MLYVTLFCCSGHVECVKWLLANRANHAVHDSNDRTPLDLAREYQHDDCAELLELMGKVFQSCLKLQQNKT